MSLPMMLGAQPGLIERNTGEVVPLTAATTAHIAEIRDYVRDLESQLREAKHLLDAEVVKRMDLACSWTLRDGPWVLTAPATDTVEVYDGHALRTDLEGLVGDGLIAQEAVDAAVEVLVEYKPRVAGIKALLKRGGAVAEIVDAHRTTAQRDRRVSVKRA